MFRKSLFAGSLALATLSSAMFVGTSADAGTGDKAFFQSVAGVWKGPGEIVAGKYKGTKFHCTISGTPSASGPAGIKLDGSCHVGVFSQPMTALISGEGSNYKGQFLDGAVGKGLDITSGNVSGNKIVVGINRKKLNGAMIARLESDRLMNVTISVKVEDQMVPVIGMKLDRQTDQIATGSVK